MRKAIKRGATEINVAADITDQSTPVSGAAKIPKPTVSGLVSTELEIMSVHIKLFLLCLTVTYENEIKVGVAKGT